MANTAGHDRRKNLLVALSPRCTYIYLYEPLKKIYTHKSEAKHANEDSRDELSDRRAGREPSDQQPLVQVTRPSVAADTGARLWSMRASRHRSMPRTSPSSSLQLYFHCFCLAFFGDNFSGRPTPSINSTAVGSSPLANQLPDTGSAYCRR
jgi:hypothetical protein